jgi:hypothetical protein
MQRYVRGWDKKEPSVVISGHPRRQPVAITIRGGNQWPSAAISGHQRPLVAAIGGGNHLGL